MQVNSVSSPTTTDLEPALTLLQQGRHAEGRALLQTLLSGWPERTDIRWILAGSLFQTGESARALQELQILIRVDPSHAAAHLLCGRIFLTLNRFDAAEQMFRHALQIEPGPVAAAGLARALLMQTRAEDAVAVIKSFLQNGNAMPELLLLQGHAFMILGQLDGAATAFESLVRMSPHDAEAKLRLAAALSDLGRHSEAESRVRAGMSEGARSPEAHFVLGRALMGQNRMEEAENELRNTVRSRPNHLGAQANLSELVWMRTGDVGEASRELDVALLRYPQLSPLRVAKAKLLLTAGKPVQALEHIEEGIDPLSNQLDASELRISAARIALEIEPGRAIEHAQSVLRLQPDNRQALSAYGDALLAQGNAMEAAKVANRLLARDHYDGRALALLASALRMSGDVRYRELFDYENLVLAQPIDLPVGWNSISDYLAELADALHRAHSLKAHPIGQSLRSGTQVELDLERSTEPAIRAFAQAIEQPIRRYLARAGSAGDPLRSRNRGQFRLKGAWSVCLKPNGFHVNHFHPEGWLSSACYIQLPDHLDAGKREGWLAFGEPGFPTNPPMPAEYFIKPEPGLLALFPSYMWHGTVPFAGSTGDSRLTIAFDVVPG